MGKLTHRLTDATRSGVYRAARGDEIVDAARGTRLDLAHVELAGAQDKGALLERLAVALALPEWFGGNWDALEECLVDLEWVDDDGYVIYYDHIDGLLAAHPDRQVGIPMREGMRSLNLAVAAGIGGYAALAALAAGTGVR